MVTLTELQESERQLSEVESQARRLESRDIPRRRFGSRVTKEDQQKAIQERQEASNVLKEVAQKRIEIQNIRNEIAQAEQSRTSQANDYTYLRRVANRYGNYSETFLRRVLGLSREEASIVKDINSGNRSVAEYSAQLQNYKQEGLKPIINNQGQIVGFEDSKRQQSISIQNVLSIASTNPEEKARYERAGIILSSPTAMTPREELAQQSLRPELRNQPVISNEVKSYREQTTSERIEAYRTKAIQRAKERASNILPTISGVLGEVPLVRRVLDTPTSYLYGLSPDNPLFKGAKQVTIGEVSAEATTKYYEFIDKYVNKADEFLITELKITGNQYNKDARRFVAKTILTGVPFIVAPEFAVTISAVSGYQKLTKGTSTEEQITGLIELSAPLIVGFSKVKSYLKEPVTIKAKSPEIQLYSEAIQKDLLQGDKLTSSAEFNIKAFQEGRYSITIPRYRYFSERGIGGLDLKAISGRLEIDELLAIFPKAKVSKGFDRFGFVKTNEFVIQEGKIVSSIDKGTPPILIKTSGRVGKGGEIRRSPITFSSFEGESISQDINLRTLRESQLKKLDISSRANIKKLLAEGEEGQAQIAFLDTIDYFNLSDGLIKISKRGQRINRTQLAGVSELKFTLEKQGKIIEIFTDEIAGVDVTFPRFREPRKVVRISGKTTRLYQEIPSDETAVSILSPANIKKTPFNQIQVQDNQKALQKAIGSSGVALSKSLKNIPEISVKEVQALEFQRIQALPRYVGGGGQTKTETRQQQSFRFEELSVTRFRDIEASVQLPNIRTGQRELSRAVERSLNREGVRALSIEIPKLQERQATRTASRLISRTGERNFPPIDIPTLKNFPSPKKPTNKFRFNLKTKSPSFSELTEGYRTFVFVKGKPVYLKGIAPKELAILRGESSALKGKTALSARFGIEPTKYRVRNVNVRSPYKNLFREFKVRQGKAIITPNTFIQKRGKRLTTSDERKLIQLARKASSKRR